MEACATERVDLVMMATRGRGSLGGKDDVGSVTERVVQTAPCPVFVVPIESLEARLRAAKAERPAVAGAA